MYAYDGHFSATITSVFKRHTAHLRHTYEVKRTFFPHNIFQTYISTKKLFCWLKISLVECVAHESLWAWLQSLNFKLSETWKCFCSRKWRVFMWHSVSYRGVHYSLHKITPKGSNQRKKSEIPAQIWAKTPVHKGGFPAFWQPAETF